MPAVRLFRTPAGELSAPETAYVDLKGRKQKGRIKGNERMERKKGRRAAVTQSRWQIFHTLYLYVNVTYNVFGGMLNLTQSNPIGMSWVFSQSPTATSRLHPRYKLYLTFSCI